MEKNQKNTPPKKSKKFQKIPHPLKMKKSPSKSFKKCFQKVYLLTYGNAESLFERVTTRLSENPFERKKKRNGEICHVTIIILQ